MKKKIVVPTDFSKSAWNALRYACEMYAELECEFYILNVYSVTGYALDSMMVPEPGERHYDNAKSKSSEGLQRVSEMLDFRNPNKKHSYIFISQFNSLLEAVKDIVEKKDIDLVVMGTKGDTNANSVIFGTNAIDLMENVRNCPVLAIPLDARYPDIEEIVFPTSFKTHFKRRQLEHMAEIARISNATVCILHVDTDDRLSELQENYKAILVESLEGIPYTFHTLHDRDTAAAVQSFVESRNSDFIAFINRKHSFFGSIFSKPLVKDLGLHSKVPVLALHDLRN